MSRRLRALWRRVALFLVQHPELAALPLTLLAGEAWARPGGGHSFSSSHSSSGGGFHSSGSSFSSGSGSSSVGYHGYGGGSDNTFFIAWLLFSHPIIGVPLLIIGLLWVVSVRNGRANREDWSTTSVPTPAPDAPAVRRSLVRIRAFDEAFSTVLFEDFVYALYAQVQEARGGSKLESLAPYMSAQARATLERLGAPERVDSVVVGALTYLRASGLDGRGPTRVTLQIESNYTERGGGRDHALWAMEHWTLMRMPEARSRPPEKARIFGCPSCGAALDAVRGNQCSYCGKRVDPGTFDWQVETIEVMSREPRGPQLTGTTEEEGTQLPTVVAPDLQQAWSDFSQKDPSFSYHAFEDRVRLIHAEFNAGWSARDLSRVRPFVSDALFQMQLYWIETYQKQGLRNVVDQAAIQRVQLAAVESDAVYDALTVRVFATGFDYTIDDAGKVVGGSKSKRRDYTEYWTLIRGSGKQGAAKADKNCPSCGAPLKINMAGSCEYCQAKVTSGDFDWVLSRIEQDETYQG